MCQSFGDGKCTSGFFFVFVFCFFAVVVVVVFGCFFFDIFATSTSAFAEVSALHSNSTIMSHVTWQAHAQSPQVG